MKTGARGSRVQVPAARTGAQRRAAAAGVALLLAMGGCATQSPVRQVAPARVPVAAAGSGTQHPAPAVPASPFSDNPVSFLIHGEFTRGEHVIVRVCLRADRSIASSSILESSGDPRFDELAITWAQRVRLRQQPPAEGRPVAPCGAVRVELHDSPEPAVVGGHDDELG